MTPRAIKLALVDPVRTTRVFIPELERRGLDYLVVESGLMDGVPEVAGAGHRLVRATASVELMAEGLRARGVTHVLGCVEPSMIYAERLCAQLGLPSNGLRLSETRRHKARTNEVLRQADLRVPRQLETDQLPALMAWIETHGLPVVLKPVDSGGTDNVYRCDSLAEVATRFQAILGARSLAGSINASVLAQEYVDGTEYIVDCVSADGVHASIAFFAYQKGTRNGRAFVYEKVRFLPAEDPVCAPLRRFAYLVLDALEIRGGASHMEVKVDSRGEVVFIEVGARLSGGDSYRMVRDARADGKSQVEYVIDAIEGRALPSGEYETARAVVRIFILAEAEGRLVGFRNLEAIRALPSFARLEWSAEVGKRVARTVDLGSVAGYVELVHEDAAVLREDERRVDELLRDGVLQIE